MAVVVGESDARTLVGAAVALRWRHGTVESARGDSRRWGGTFLGGGGVLDGQVKSVLGLLDLGRKRTGPDRRAMD